MLFGRKGECSSVHAEFPKLSFLLTQCPNWFHHVKLITQVLGMFLEGIGLWCLALFPSPPTPSSGNDMTRPKGMTVGGERGMSDLETHRPFNQLVSSRGPFLLSCFPTQQLLTKFIVMYTAVPIDGCFLNAFIFYDYCYYCIVTSVLNLWSQYIEFIPPPPKCPWPSTTVPVYSSLVFFPPTTVWLLLLYFNAKSLLLFHYMQSLEVQKCSGVGLYVRGLCTNKKEKEWVHVLGIAWLAGDPQAPAKHGALCPLSHFQGIWISARENSNNKNIFEVHSF